MPYRQETTERLIWLLIRKKATDEEIIKSVVRMLMIIAKGRKIEKPFLYIRKVLDSIKKESKGLKTYKELISMLEKETGANRRIIKEAIKRFEQQNSVAEVEHTTADTKENKQVTVIYERFKKLLEVVIEEEPNINYRTILNTIRDLLRKGMQQGDIILTLLKMIEDIKKKIKPNKHYPNIIPNVFSYLVKIIRNIQAIRNKKLPEQLKRIRKVLKATKEQAREALNMHIEAIIKGKKIINHERYYFKKLKDIVTKDMKQKLIMKIAKTNPHKPVSEIKKIIDKALKIEDIRRQLQRKLLCGRKIDIDKLEQHIKQISIPEPKRRKICTKKLTYLFKYIKIFNKIYLHHFTGCAIIS